MREVYGHPDWATLAITLIAIVGLGVVAVVMALRTPEKERDLVEFCRSSPDMVVVRYPDGEVACVPQRPTP